MNLGFAVVLLVGILVIGYGAFPSASSQHVETTSTDTYLDPIFHTSARDKVSEGAIQLGSPLINNDGYTGKGVKVAIIDAGFDINNPEISANIKDYRSFSTDSNIEGSSLDDTKHGTAVAEIIVDIAPDAELYLYNFATLVEFLNLMDYLIQRGDIDLISMSLGWESFPVDGTSPPAQKLDEARDSGILFITSAGNEAQRHWQGTFSDADGDRWHNFGLFDEQITIRALEGDDIRVVLTWYDSPSQDYDLYIYVDGSLAAVSDNRQPDSPPVEGLTGTLTADALLDISIRSYSSNENANFHLYTSHNLLEHRVARSSLSVPADARGSLSVGAAYWEDNKLEAFSSRGPTDDGRIKPDITSYDGVETTAYCVFALFCDRQFYGTSASAPHVAGAAALLMEKYPEATPDDIQLLLESTTSNFHPKSNRDGTGNANLSLFQGADILALDNSSDCNPCFFPRTFNVPVGGTVTWTNTSTSPVTIVGEFGGTDPFDSGPLSRGESFSQTFVRDGTYDYKSNSNASGHIVVGSIPSIQGTVFSDSNGNGTKDAGEAGIETTVSVTTMPASTTTNSAGGYIFEGITSGTHTVKVTVPTGFTTTPGESDSRLVEVTEQRTETVNFALRSTLSKNVTLNITAYDDSNSNQIRDPSESGVPGLPVLIYVPSTGESNIVITGIDGTASKDDLPPAEFYAIALPTEAHNVTTPVSSLGGIDYKGVLHVENPEPDSTHAMNIAIGADVCDIIPPDNFAFVLLGCTS